MIDSRNVKIKIDGIIKDGKRFATRKAAENWIKRHGGEIVSMSAHSYIVA